MMMSGRSSSRYPFTSTQWQELEHQALIFKYMASGIPIPSDLIIPIRRSFFLDSSSTSPSLSFPPHPSMGWSCYQMGYGSRKAEDPEPGRCRRTDGKKWRCSKEAYPDSKYCEKHMHRGKNRSRKPVEISLSNPTSTPTSSSAPPVSISTPQPPYHLLYPYRPPSLIPFPPQNNSASSHFHLDSGGSSSYSSDRDYRYCHGMKDVDGYTFFSEGSGTDREGSWQFRPLGMSSLGEPKQSSYYHKEEEEKQEQHCFVLGADFKLEKPMKGEREEATQRPLRHFFDEWPQKNKGSWMDLEAENPNQGGSYSKTQLSISIPMAHHDFPQ